MKLAGYPLYVRARDLALWLSHKELAGLAAHAALASEIGRAGRELVVAIAIAISFPGRRAGAQAAADEEIVRLREGLRCARDLGVLEPRAARFALLELDGIGRMLGGWRKRTRRRAPPAHEPPAQGARAPAAPGG